MLSDTVEEEDDDEDYEIKDGEFYEESYVAVVDIVGTFTIELI